MSVGLFVLASSGTNFEIFLCSKPTNSHVCYSWHRFHLPCWLGPNGGGTEGSASNLRWSDCQEAVLCEDLLTLLQCWSRRNQFLEEQVHLQCWSLCLLLYALWSSKISFLLDMVMKKVSIPILIESMLNFDQIGAKTGDLVPRKCLILQCQSVGWGWMEASEGIPQDKNCMNGSLRRLSMQ